MNSLSISGKWICTFVGFPPFSRFPEITPFLLDFAANLKTNYICEMSDGESDFSVNEQNEMEEMEEDIGLDSEEVLLINRLEI